MEGEAYPRRLKEAKSTASVPVIASLNGTSKGRWARYAARWNRADADALDFETCRLPSQPIFQQTEAIKFND